MTGWLAVLTLSTAVASSAEEAPPVLVREVTVVDVASKSRGKELDVLVRDGRIAAVGPHLPAPAGAVVVPGKGKFLIPGLWDLHVHVWDADRALPLFLANGVIGIRNMGGPEAAVKGWRDELRAGKRLGPRVVACGPVLDGAPPIHPDQSVVVGDPAAARPAVDALHTAGWDFVKVYDNLQRDAYVAIAKEAKKLRLPVAGHVPLAMSPAEASDLGQASIEHLDGIDEAASPAGEGFRHARLERVGRPLDPDAMKQLPTQIATELSQLAQTYDPGRARKLFKKLARNHTALVPTLAVASRFAEAGSPALEQDARLAYVAPAERDAWQHNPIVHTDQAPYVEARKQALRLALRMTGEAHKAGVRILAGTDSGGVPYLYDGFSLHDELALLVEAGFTPREALSAATRDAAAFLGLADEGTVAVGKRADLVLLQKDPLADIQATRTVEAVLVGGRVLDRAALDRLLNDAKAPAH